MKLDEIDIATLNTVRDTALPLSEVWRICGQDLAYESFRYRCDRLYRAGLLRRKKAYSRIFIQASPGGLAHV